VEEPDVVLDGAAGVEAGVLGALSPGLESDLVSEDGVSFLDSVEESEAGAELLLA
jgi:hypothetical protein